MIVDFDNRKEWETEKDSVFAVIHPAETWQLRLQQR